MILLQYLNYLNLPIVNESSSVTRATTARTVEGTRSQFDARNLLTKNNPFSDGVLDVSISLGSHAK